MPILALLSGYSEVQKSASERITSQAIALGAKMVIVPSAATPIQHRLGRTTRSACCSRSWRFPGFLGREVMAGRLQLKPIGTRQACHLSRPCKSGRHGGVFERRRVLEALGVDMRARCPSNRTANFCCGGGAGPFVMEKAEPMRNAA